MPTDHRLAETDSVMKGGWFRTTKAICWRAAALAGVDKAALWRHECPMKQRASAEPFQQRGDQR
jgi:hypothetical protein